jgi:nitroreductase
VGVETFAVTPKAEAINWRAWFWHGCLAISEGYFPAGRGASVVEESPFPEAAGEPPPEHPAAMRAATTRADATRTRTEREYQRLLGQLRRRRRHPWPELSPPSYPGGPHRARSSNSYGGPSPNTSVPRERRVDIDEVLYTTRAMRRVRPDPIPMEVQTKILDAAIRAPTGGNAQNWRFLLVDDRETIERLGPLYRDSIEQLWKTIYAERLAVAAEHPDLPASVEMLRVQKSAQWLADHFEQVPLYLFGFVQADPTGGSIFPAVWSAQLAARAQGVGSSLTVVLGVFHPHEVLDILAVPTDEHWVMACCVSFGYPTGRWGVAPRRPVHEVSYRNRWGSDVGFTVDRPLWPPG